MMAELAEAPWLRSEESRHLMDILTAGNVQARFVGGCVRDALLGNLDPDIDLDVATPLPPDEVIKRLEGAGSKAIPTGIAHGTVTALVRDQSFEITTLRKDVACDGRHAKVEFTDDFQEDAARRDFTINAMSTDRHGRLVDYFGGVDDLHAGRIRFVGEADARVREDYLRILRFFRFFARYGRPPVDRQALEACREGAEGLARISGERIRTEMLKLLAAGNAVAALGLMFENKVLQQVLPIEPDFEALAGLINVAPDSDPLLRLAALLRSSAGTEPALSAVSSWNFSTSETKRLERLVGEPLFSLPLSMSDAKRGVYRLGSETYLDLLRLSSGNVAELDAGLPVPDVPPFPLTGQDLIERGVSPGPALGKLLKDMETWWLGKDLEPDREACLQELERQLSGNPTGPAMP